MSLPDYMADLDLQARRDERARPRRNNPTSQSEQTQPLIVRQPPATLRQTALQHNNDIYRMTSRPKGLFLLVNNINFTNHDTREGAEKDQDDLMNLFRKLGYRVECVQDQTRQEMETKIRQFSRRPDLTRVDSMFIAVTSHGHGNRSWGTRIITHDEVLVECEWVVEQFNNRNCVGMRYKPKVFIFQLCRGQEGELTEEAGGGKTTRKDGTAKSEPCRLNDDVLIAHATVPGFAANRHCEFGSWFLQAICQVYSQHACEDHLEKMHKKVDKLIKQCVSDDPGHPAMQTSETLNRGFKEFYFYPGVYRDRN